MSKLPRGTRWAERGMTPMAGLKDSAGSRASGCTDLGLGRGLERSTKFSGKMECGLRFTAWSPPLHDQQRG